MNTDSAYYSTDISAKVKSVSGSSWYEVRMVSLSKTGAFLEGRFTLREASMVELYVPSSNPNIEYHHLFAMVVSVDQTKLAIKFI